MRKQIGVIGVGGRMGSLLSELIAQHQSYVLGPSFMRSRQSTTSLEDVFKANKIVVDFSSSDLVEHTLAAALSVPKPFVICTTGWQKDHTRKQIKALSKEVPIVIAPNTSIGACLQLYLAKQVAKILGEEYDIDILEKHHRNKSDAPSGTALALLNSVQEEKKRYHNLNYKPYSVGQSPRPKQVIGFAVRRSGNLPARRAQYILYSSRRGHHYRAHSV